MIRRLAAAFLAASLVGAPGAVGVAGVAGAQEAGPGAELSDEVAALSLRSPELDRATARLADTVAELDAARVELVDNAADAATTATTLVAVTSMSERRDAQLDKARAAHRRELGNLSLLATEWFVTGFGALENLDPAISEERREELARQQVFAETLAERATRAVEHTRGAVDALRSQTEALDEERAELTQRVERLGSRRAELDATIAAATGALPELESQVRAAQLGAQVEGTRLSALALDAYWRAQLRSAVVDPDCAVSWSTLAGIGRTESRHGTYLGAVLGADGVASPPIYGPLLDGSNDFAVVGDTDGGALDGSSAADRAVGPMQFLPGTWRAVGVDGTGDGIADPQNIFDAAASAAVYLCRSGPGLDAVERRRRALLTYNRSDAYVDAVLRAETEYREKVALG